MPAYKYLADKNPEQRYLDGVPLRDLTAADVEQLTPYLQRSVAECPFYVAVDETAAHTPDAVITASRRARASGPSEVKATTESEATEQ